MEKQEGNQKRVTIKDVAQRAGLSFATVSRVINQNYHVEQETRERVLKAIEELEYYPNRIARSLKSQKTWLIGIVVTNISNPFFMNLIKGIEDVVSICGYHILLASTHENIENEQTIIDIFMEKKVDAIIVATCQKEKAYFEKIQRRKVPIVMVDRYIDDAGADIVSEDNEKCSYDIVSYLIENGHKRIMVVNGDIYNANTARERYFGYLKALEIHGIEKNKDFIIDGSNKTAYQQVKNFFSSRVRREWPTAIFATNNIRAENTLKALFELGISIPEDISIISYGNIPSADMVSIKLTHIEQDTHIIGEKAGRFLLQRIGETYSENTRKYVITSSIVFGNSVKKMQ